MGKSSPERNNNNNNNGGLLKKGPWTVEEDQKLVDYIQKHGHGRWRTLPKNAGLKRCGKSCRLRWTNYLRPDIKRGKFSPEEEEIIIQLHRVLGNKWSSIAARLPGRTDNEIKNYWNTHIKKKLLRMGIDPVTHTPRLDLLELSSIISSSLNQSQINPSNLLSLGSILNPDLINLATILFSPPQNNNLQSLQQNQVQYQYPVLSSQPQFPNQTQLDPFCSNYSDFGYCNNNNVVPNYGCDVETTTTGNMMNFGYYGGGDQNVGNMKFGSLLSSEPSTSSTPLNSSSTNFNVNGCTEDERDSYCSDVLFDGLDAIGGFV